MQHRLYRSTDEKIIAGVCGGLGRYFEIDPSLVRVIMVLLAFVNGIGILAYLIAWIVFPKQTQETDVSTTQSAESERRYSSWNKYLPGIILIAIGLVFLVRENWYWFDFEEFWPILFIALGLFLLLNRKKSAEQEDSVHSQNGVNAENAHNGGSVS